jgi:ribosomal protein S21
VEWIGSDKSRTLTQTSAVEQIFRAHPFYESPTQKRKRGAEKLQDAAEVKLPKTETRQEDHQPSPIASTANTTRTADTTDTANTADIPQPNPVPGATSTPHPPHPPHHHTPDYTFYLLRPRTSSTRPVLIPLRHDATLAESLTNRTVLEFPTIYMFPTSAGQLPPDFMLEQDYIKQEGEEQRELETLLRDVDPQTLKGLREGEQSQTQTAGEEVDSARILDVLKRDLGAEW